MTIIEVITKIDNLKPNSYSESDKITWLSELDGRVRKEIIDTHVDAPATPFPGYDESTDQSTVLLAEAPYDEMYVLWLEEKIDYSNGEYGKYNNSVTMFNSAYSNYERYYNRNHTPIKKKLKFFS